MGKCTIRFNTLSLNILIEDSIERIRSYIKNIAEETIDYSVVKQIQPLFIFFVFPMFRFLIV
jgi:phosphate uptake regulator